MLKKKKLEADDVQITGVDISGDGENWESSKDMNYLGGLEGALAHIVDLIYSGERVFLRTRYVDHYSTGKRGLPKTGPIFEVTLHEIQPIRQVIEGTLVKQIEEGKDKK